MNQAGAALARQVRGLRRLGGSGRLSFSGKVTHALVQIRPLFGAAIGGSWKKHAEIGVFAHEIGRETNVVLDVIVGIGKSIIAKNASALADLNAARGSIRAIGGGVG